MRQKTSTCDRGGQGERSQARQEGSSIHRGCCRVTNAQIACVCDQSMQNLNEAQPRAVRLQRPRRKESRTWSTDALDRPICP
jgi:hypothetical protein